MLILFYPKTKNVTGVFVASALVTAAFWLKRIIIVVPALVFPNIPYETGVYIPTWVEWALVAGVFGLGGFIYAIFVKLFPIVELEAAH
jgi:Ni/Fe-hydrogenase subunit HybB-like protein